MSFFTELQNPLIQLSPFIRSHSARSCRIHFFKKWRKTSSHGRRCPSGRLKVGSSCSCLLITNRPRRSIMSFCKEGLPWVAESISILGFSSWILWLRLRLCAEWHEGGGHAAQKINSSYGIGTRKFWVNLICKSFSKILRLNEIFAIHWILSWMKWT